MPIKFLPMAHKGAEVEEEVIKVAEEAITPINWWQRVNRR
jgi:hypothetical protein